MMSAPVSHNIVQMLASFGLRRRRSGMALVIVMVVVMLIALAAYSFNQQMTDAYRLGSLQTERTEARLAFASGIEYGLALAELSRSDRSRFSAATQESFFRIPVDQIDTSSASANNSTSGSNRVGSGSWTFSLLRPAVNQGGALLPEPGWVDESAKLNVRMLLQWERSFPGHARSALLNLPGASPELVDSFLSAVEPTSKQSSLLQERIETRTQTVLPEQQIAQLWTGGDWDHNFAIDPLEQAIQARKQPDEQLGPSSRNERVVAWRDFLTFKSGCRNENRLGKPRIYLNDRNLSRLHARLRATWDERRAAFVIAARQFGLSATNGSDSSTTGPNESVGPNEFESTATGLAWTPDLSVAAKFAIASQLDLIDASVSIPRPGQSPLTLASPFSRETPEFAPYLDYLLDDVTLNLADSIPGQVNVNLAPLEVLLGIPGMSFDTADAIVRKRTVGTDQPRDSLAWLITEEAIEISQLKRLLPWLTSGGDCFSTQVVAYRDSLSPEYRGTVIFDARHRPATAANVQLWHAWSRVNLNSQSSFSVTSDPTLTTPDTL